MSQFLLLYSPLAVKTCLMGRALRNVHYYYHYVSLGIPIIIIIMYHWGFPLLLHTTEGHHYFEDVSLVDFTYLVFICMPGERYRRRHRSLLLWWRDAE